MTRPFFLLLLHVLATVRCYQYDCSRSEYNRCVRIADPLVKEARLIFPDNLDDIDSVCRAWNKFVDCLKSYTDKCFSPEQRRQFNKAVENPIESVHKMCMQPTYQKEYLQHAPCIKSTITDRNHCGPHYNLLVSQVERGEYISRETLCCSHDRFKHCILEQTRRLCDGGATDGPASKFSTQILDKALSFLQDQCFNYIPNSGDCDDLTDPTPWSTIRDVVVPKELPTSSWLPSTSVSFESNSDRSSSDTLGLRTRPSSYGRASSWSDSVTQPEPSSSLSSPKSTISTWHVLSQTPGGIRQAVEVQSSGSSGYDSAPSPSTETWYPAAGNQIGNEVDEPNQQGLTNAKNVAADVVKTKQVFSMTVVATIIAFC